MFRVLIAIVFLAVAGAARGQDDMTQAVYGSIENNIRQEFNVVMERIKRSWADHPGVSLVNIHRMWTLIYYNRAVMFSICAAEAEQYRAPGASRVPAQNNLFLNTCVEEKGAGLSRFVNMFSYTSMFFPERSERCGEASRLHEQETLLPPHEFLRFGQPKLYDFARYNSCLMTVEPTSPAAR